MILYPPPIDPAAGAALAANNLSDLASAASARANLEIDSTQEVLNKVANRATAPRRISDGATTNRAEIAQYGTTGALAASPATFEIEIPKVPETATGVTTFLCALASSTTSAGTNGLAAQMDAAAGIYIRANGASSGVDYRWLYWSAFRTTYSGQAVRIVVSFPEGDSTTDPTITINGVDKTSSFALTTAGTPPNWMDAALVDTYKLYGFNWPSGDAPKVRIYNAAWSSTEAAVWTAGGQRPAWAERAGSQVSYATGNSSTFDSGVGSWTNKLSGTITATGGKGVIDFTGGSVFYDGTTFSGLSLVAGRKYRLKVNLSDMLGDTGSVFVGMQNGAALPMTASIVAGDNDVIASPTYTGAIYIVRGSKTWTSISIDNFEIYELGTLDAPITNPQGLRFTGDALGRFSRRLLGITGFTESVPAPLVLPFAYTGSSIQLGGGVLLDGSAYRVVSISGNSDASVNLSIGTTSSGTEIVNAQAVNGNFDISTFASRISTGASLYLTCSGNASGTIVIKLERLA